MMEIRIGYPSPEEEEEIVTRTTGESPPWIQPVASATRR
jgi:hypothetical protein